MGVFQPMPPLTDDQMAALREDVAEHGVLVPVTVDQHGRIIDGHNRSAIADELGIPYPTITVDVADDDAAMDLAVTLNGARRHLNQEQKRALIEHELIRRPDDSDRAISRRVGCSPTTVGTVRSERRTQAEELTRRWQEAMRQGYRSLWKVLHELLLCGAPIDEMLTRAEAAKDRSVATIDDLAADAFDLVNRQALVDFYVYTTLFNDLSDIRSMLPDDLVIPWRVDQEDARKVLEHAFSGIAELSKLDTSTVSLAAIDALGAAAR
ncbi:ParB N-terminal domain-containing protein [Nocardioides nitrophenolicus]|uniref:ParB N-terminal domain-containing protein n=1 Tax=Nocardioides nitrophenolicus TaxID=60489 RepID=UPI00195959C5|nr:ParB N-terminal domain-containing protein [Nocardioides nitrophenolicus]MBM7518300.1 ParB family chromosome partitioning protein [Nocardioides nitrophenolicus]